MVTKPSRSKIKPIYRKNEAHHKVFCPASRYFPRVSRAARGSGRRSATTLAAAAEAGRISNAVRTTFSFLHSGGPKLRAASWIEVSAWARKLVALQGEALEFGIGFAT